MAIACWHIANLTLWRRNIDHYCSSQRDAEIDAKMFTTLPYSYTGRIDWTQAGKRLLGSLLKSAKSRDIEPDRQSLRDPAVRTMAAVGYDTLQPEVEDALAPFETAYQHEYVNDFSRGKAAAHE